ncbi:phage major capsid protein [Niallia sp. Man26]|uniref:phage major capsid protein n=1 Tax=Niallia sp. Man26 TaxID=2912824 RepID=UPI001EDAF900|nr:phage major capsid protein [Niallia sp. Man26]UPO88331.1 phage major capsid protein [Niallia sp. Man26]
MNKTEYLAKRKALLGEAETLLNEGKLAEYEAKENEIKALDEQFDKVALAQANMNALKAKAIDNSVIIPEENGQVIASTEPVKKNNEKEIYLTAWTKTMMGQKLAQDEQTVFENVNNKFQNAMQTTEQHTLLIPETVRDGIWREAGEMYPLLGDATMTFVPGDLTILKETNSGEDAEWYDEETEVKDGEFSLGELNLTGNELAKAIPISWKLRKMSVAAFIPYIQTLLAEKVGAAMAKAIVKGKGKPGVSDTFKPQPRGILTVLEAQGETPQIVEYSSTDKLSYDKLTQAMGKLKSTYKNGSAIYATSSTIWGSLATLKDAQGRPLFVPDVTTGGVGRIFGLAVKEDDSLADGEILFGNVSRGYAINVNENMSIYTEDHIKKRYTDYMSYSIVDGDVLTTNAFAFIREATPTV